MAKRLGFSAVSQNIRYVAQNADVMYLVTTGTEVSGSAAGGGQAHIVSCNVSSADFTVASAAQGAVLTVGAKNSQIVDGSGTATHLILVSTSGTRFLLQTTVSSQVLASGNTVNIASWTVTANASANNA